jgi:hypothetical protein
VLLLHLLLLLLSGSVRPIVRLPDGKTVGGTICCHLPRARRWVAPFAAGKTVGGTICCWHHLLLPCPGDARPMPA